MLNDLSRWLLDTIISGVGRLFVALFSLGFAAGVTSDRPLHKRLEFRWREREI